MRGIIPDVLDAPSRLDVCCEYFRFKLQTSNGRPHHVFSMRPFLCCARHAQLQMLVDPS
jgi:hypothetical protein